MVLPIERGGIDHSASSLQRRDQMPNVPSYEFNQGIDLLATKLTERMLSYPDQITIVALGGPTNSGKTTISNTLSTRLGREHLGVISMDNFFKGNAFLQEQASLGRSDLNWDHPEYVDTAALAAFLPAIKAGQNVDLPRYNFEISAPDGTENFMPPAAPGVVVFEGIHALNDEIAALADINVYVKTSRHGGALRRMLRDMDGSRGDFPLLEILRYYLETVVPMSEQFVEPTIQNADMVLLNDYYPELEAGRAGVREVQVKFQGTLAERKLRAVGAEMIAGCIQQSDIYLNPEGVDLSKSGESLRIRRTDGKWPTLTYKGPREQSTVRKRPKLDIPLDESVVEMVTRNYPNNLTDIAKNRAIFQVGPVLVCQDTDITISREGSTFSLPNHIELRTTSDVGEDILYSVANRLGLDESSYIPSAYSEMLTV